MLKSRVQNTNLKHVSTKRRKKRKSSCTCVNIASANKVSIARLADESPIPSVDYNTPATGQTGKIFLAPHK